MKDYITATQRVSSKLMHSINRKKLDKELRKRVQNSAASFQYLMINDKVYRF